MRAARWADDIRTKDPSLSHRLWHFVDFPFKPEGEPPSVKTIPPLNPNLLTAIEENERIVESGSEPEKHGIALTWLFHLVGDIHQPLHAETLHTGISRWRSRRQRHLRPCCGEPPRVTAAPLLGWVTDIEPECSGVKKHGNRASEQISPVQPFRGWSDNS